MLITSSPNPHVTDKMLRQAEKWRRLTFRRLTRRTPPWIDVEQIETESYLGLWDAVTRYNPDLRSKWRTHVITIVRRALVNEMRNQGGRVWSDGRMSGRALIRGACVSLERFRYHDEAFEMQEPLDFLHDRRAARALDVADARTELLALFPLLTPIQWQVIRLHGLEEHTASEAGGRLGLGESRVHQIKREAVCRMREAVAA